ncbi:MAG: lipopolysaccharide biosynthesis protein [Paraclostridium sp.]
MRIKNSIKNIYIGLFSQIIIILLGFISRRVFLDSLGQEYLGINGLISNVLSVIILIESGIGASIVYNLYKPLAEKKEHEILALVQLYKKTYGILSLIMLGLSLIIYPFLGMIVNESDSIAHLGLVYAIFVVKNMISYFNAHKWALIKADQKGYKLEKTNLIFQVITTISKMIILIITKNYVLFLLVEMILYVCQNIYNTYMVNRVYPYIKTKQKYVVSKDIKIDLKRKVKAMFLHNIGGYLVFGTDNILIATFVNVGTVGLYSNYTMIVGQLSALLSPILGGVGASIGNLIATEDGNKNYSIFRVMYLVNFWIYSWAAIFLYNLLEPFIDWWLGNGYLLDKTTFIVILINFYITGLRRSTETFKDKAGLFEQDKYASLLEGAINLIVSIFLARKFGLVGIFMGTTISTLSVVFWTHPYIVYKYIFKKPVVTYYKKYAQFALITIMTGILTSLVCNFVVEVNNFFDLVCKGIICLVIPNIIYTLLLYKTSEFKYILNIIKLNRSKSNKKGKSLKIN